MQEPLHQGISWLRWANKKVLRDLKSVVLLHDHAEPIAAVIPYNAYMALQDILLTHPLVVDFQKRQLAPTPTAEEK